MDDKKRNFKEAAKVVIKPATVLPQNQYPFQPNLKLITPAQLLQRAASFQTPN